MYYTSIPLITCNILFYSITSLSNSITSTQNVFRFIYEHKDNDYLIYKNELNNMDLIYKMKIINELIFDTIQKYIPEKEKYNKFLEYITNPIIENNDNENNNYTMIDVNYDMDIISIIDKPIIYSIMSISEILQKINIVINSIKDKIMKHKKIYFKNIINLCLKNEISELKFYSNLLDMRYNIFIDFLKIYLPLNVQNLKN
jgi:hypothetical protein